MRSQPGASTAYPEPYDTLAPTYDRLDDWIVRAWGEKPRPERVDFLQELWAGQAAPVSDVLEVCCGTGLVLEEIARRGYRVTGLDRSAPMLEVARARLGDDVPLVRAELPDIPMEETFDAVVCVGAALNYMPDEGELEKTFRSVGSVLRPGGSFVFDVLSRRMMDGHAGSSVWSADLGDFTFIWKFDNHPSGAYCDASYTQFLRTGDAQAPEHAEYTVTRELHRLFTLAGDTIRGAARRAGLVCTGVHDNYTPAPATDATLYETWAFTRK
ncbi:class I SAM-dependent DNA methyltransferase [Streptomyces sp. HB2AG]|uniref:class I SAM-dependent DNA methyltransferase n=1 Tax=Streptomyces sp. HB2AG TaxID=2983400 RepID=UPI0022AB3B2D|nr:class I SAM-dependent methyltransferase [Streptomyces sp. HB2AG]MCZ2523487.1 class I SAM-dependent methyltransferase [Streptomyces sp. HB2AG]